MALKDLPDYTREMVIRYEGGFIGLEELAARLGSIVPWDMKGNIVLMEDFESELTEWTSDCDALGSTAARSSRHKFSGDWALKFYNAGVASAFASFYRYFHFPGLGKYAAFARFCLDSNCCKVYLLLDFYSGTKEYYLRVDYDSPTTTLSVKTTGWADHNVSTSLTLEPNDYTWYPILVTFDLETGYYDKLWIADQEYDISDIPLYYEEAGANPEGYVDVGTERGNAHYFTAYVDDIIIAKNVP